ncbi:MAG: hypothetical protein K6U89_12325 [Chloroflexi bacterium]|nr:hypothetical protein [Chloroflexota bacterium]
MAIAKSSRGLPRRTGTLTAAPGAPKQTRATRTLTLRADGAADRQTNRTLPVAPPRTTQHDLLVATQKAAPVENDYSILLQMIWVPIIILTLLWLGVQVGLIPNPVPFAP